MAVVFTLEDKSIKEKSVLDYFKAIWMQADSYFTQFIEPEWRVNERLYLDLYEIPVEKMDWQMDIKTPVVDNLVTRMTNFFTRILVSSEARYFTVDAPDKDKANGYRDILAGVLRDNKYPTDVFSVSHARGLLRSLYVNKVCFVTEERKMPAYNEETGEYTIQTTRKSRTRIFPVDPYNIRLDPSGQKRYIIEIQPDVPLHDFVAMAQANGWSQIDEIVKYVNEQTTQTQTQKHLPTVCIKYAYAKALTNKMGKSLLDDVYMVVVDDKFVVYVGKNVLPDGEFPYIAENPIQSLDNVYGRSYISKIKSIVINYIEAMNLMMDAFRVAALGVYEYDASLVSTDAAHLFTNGLKPGAFYPKTGSGQVLRGVFNNSLQNSAAQGIIFILDRELQNRSFQNEFFAGQPTAKGRPTFGEISLKTQESTAFMTDIANYIEDKIIAKLFWLVLVTEMVYMDDEEKVDMTENISEASVRARVLGLSFTERMNDVLSMTLEVRGISGKIRKLGSFNRMMQVFSVLGNIPGFMTALRANQLLDSVLEAIDDIPPELFDENLLAQMDAMGDQATAQAMSAPPTTPQGQST